MTPYRSSLSRPWATALFVVLAVGALLFGTQRAAAQTLSLTGGMTLLLGPPDAVAPAVLGTPQDGQQQAAPPPQPQTVYIVETQAPPGYGQPTYGQPGYGQPGATGPGMMGPSGQGSMEAQAEADGRISRVILGPIMGYFVGGMVAVVGALIGAGAGGCFDAGLFDTSCVLGLGIGAFTGELLGMPLGVVWVGSWFHGMGTFGTSFLGGLAGLGVAVLIYAVAPTPNVLAGGALLPLAGAVIGYELSSSANASAGAAGLALTPVFDRGTLTGGTGSVRFTF